MPRQEGGMVKLRRLWKGCWKKGGASANFRRWASKLDQVIWDRRWWDALGHYRFELYMLDGRHAILIYRQFHLFLSLCGGYLMLLRPFEMHMQMVSSSTAAAASTSASYPLFSIGMSLMVHISGKFHTKNRLLWGGGHNVVELIPASPELSFFLLDRSWSTFFSIPNVFASWWMCSISKHVLE